MFSVRSCLFPAWIGNPELPLVGGILSGDAVLILWGVLPAGRRAQGQGSPSTGGMEAEKSPGHPLYLSTVRTDCWLLFFCFQQLVSLSLHLLAAAVAGDTKQPLLAAGSGWGGLQVLQEALAWGCCQSWLLERFWAVCRAQTPLPCCAQL